MFIHIDEEGNPVEYPVLYDNVVAILGTTDITDELLAKHNLARIKNFDQTHVASIDEEVERGEIIKNSEGEVEQLWIINKISVEEKIRRWILGPRQYKLVTTDWTQALDAPISDTERKEWAEYRQQLRDMTSDLDLIEKLSDPADLKWPKPPKDIDSKWVKKT